MFGTALSASATRVLLLGSGELGKEVAIECQRLAAETLALQTSPYAFADDFAGFSAAVADIGFPCIVKPLMSSSGKGQSMLQSQADL